MKCLDWPGSTIYEVRKLPFRSWGGTCQVTNFKGEPVWRAERELLRRHVHVEALRGDCSSLLLRRRGHVPMHYEVLDMHSREHLGGLVRRSLVSLLRDEWKFLSASAEEVGRIREDTLKVALDRRFFDSPLPQDFHAEIGGIPVCVFEQQPARLALRIRIRLLPAAEALLDTRLALAAAVLLCLVEGRQRRLGSAWF